MTTNETTLISSVLEKATDVCNEMLPEFVAIDAQPPQPTQIIPSSTSKPVSASTANSSDEVQKPAKNIQSKKNSGVTNNGKKRRRSRRAEGRPQRPLSAYNLFFQEERAKIISSSSDDVEEKDSEPSEPKPKKRRHCKTHGKISFADLAKTIGKKWKELDQETRSTFEERAKVEKEKQAVKLAEWKRKMKQQKEAKVLLEKERSDAGATVETNLRNDKDASTENISKQGPQEQSITKNSSKKSEVSVKTQTTLEEEASLGRLAAGRFNPVDGEVAEQPSSFDLDLETSLLPFLDDYLEDCFSGCKEALKGIEGEGKHVRNTHATTAHSCNSASFRTQGVAHSETMPQPQPSYHEDESLLSLLRVILDHLTRKQRQQKQLYQSQQKQRQESGAIVSHLKRILLSELDGVSHPKQETSETRSSLMKMLLSKNQPKQQREGKDEEPKCISVASAKKALSDDEQQQEKEEVIHSSNIDDSWIQTFQELDECCLDHVNELISFPSAA